MRQITFLLTGLFLFFTTSAALIYSDEPNVPDSDNVADIDAAANNDDSKTKKELNSNDASQNAKKLTPPTQKDVQRELESWLKSSTFADDDSIRQGVLSLWKETADNVERVGGNLENEIATGSPADADLSKLSNAELFELSIESMKKASNHIAEYLKVCDSLAWRELPYGQKLVVPQIPLHIHLGESNTTQYLYNSLRMYLALKLVQGRFYSDAIKILEDIKPENCINPSELFIAKAIIYNSLSLHKEGIKSIKDFRELEKTGVTISRRHSELAKLLEYEMKDDDKEDDNPQEIAKKMDNARRILGKGDPGKEAQETEDDILKSLEKLIEKIEEQAKKSQQDGDSDSESLQSNNPGQDEKIMRGKAPGNVDRKEFDQNANGWGAMPPKDREAALSKIEREFPSHYRDIIESYFREMANGNDK
jgi:hypothetical protein